MQIKVGTGGGFRLGSRPSTQRTGSDPERRKGSVVWPTLPSQDWRHKLHITHWPWSPTPLTKGLITVLGWSLIGVNAPPKGGDLRCCETEDKRMRVQGRYWSQTAPMILLILSGLGIYRYLCWAEDECWATETLRRPRTGNKKNNWFGSPVNTCEEHQTTGLPEAAYDRLIQWMVGPFFALCPTKKINRCVCSEVSVLEGVIGAETKG